MAIHVLDPYYLAITALITLGWQSLGFAIAYGLQIDTITDFWSAFNVLTLAWITWGLGNGDDPHARNIVATVFVTVWAVRLGAWQLFRMLKMGGDSRFDEMRSNPLKFAGFWTFQLVWVWTITMPVIILNSPAAYESQRKIAFGTGTDIAGVIIWVIGISCEALADLQKYRFKTVTKPPKGAITNAGIWKYSRRPNYFGEIVHWLGIWLLCLAPGVEGGSSTRARAALIGTIVSPLLTIALLLFLSGIPLAEKPGQQKYYLMSYGPDGQEELEPFKEQKETDPWKRMKAFRERTSLLIPLPNGLYKPLPAWLKSTLLLDFPFYNFDERKDGDAAIKEARQKKNDDNNRSEQGQSA